jgi:hypothetical protein
MPLGITASLAFVAESLRADIWPLVRTPVGRVREFKNVVSFNGPSEKPSRERRIGETKYFLERRGSKHPLGLKEAGQE